MDTSALMNGTAPALLNGNNIEGYMNGDLVPEQHPVVKTMDEHCVPSTSAVPIIKPVSEETEMTYDSQFPALPEVSRSNIAASSSPWFKGGVNGDAGKSNPIVKVRSNRVTEMYSITAEERRLRELISHNAGESNSHELKICADIQLKTGTSIEMHSTQSGALNFLITGKEDKVQDAKKRLAAELQAPAVYNMMVPKEHIRHILGKSARRLTELEEKTGTKIRVPKIDSDANEPVQIRGAKENIEMAIHEIQLISAEVTANSKEIVPIEKDFHCFIIGPFGETLSQLQSETGAKINVPPISVMSNDIIITGELSAVQKAKKRVLEIYKTKKDACTTFSMVIKKEQHKYIIGPKGSAINEFFRDTGVYIEMPSDQSSEQIILRGEQNKMGQALHLLYEKAHYVVTSEMPAPSWIQKRLLGKKGQHFSTLQVEFPKVQVSFKSEENIIQMQGPRNEVEIAKQIFQREIVRITEQFKVKEILVDQRLLRYIIGKSGENIKKIRSQTGADINICDGQAEKETIRIEGSDEAVNNAYELLKEDIRKAQERDAEITKDIIIEQRFHRNIIGAKGESIKEIRSRFNVMVILPDSSEKSDKVSIRGNKDSVEACYKHLSQINKQLLIDNYRLELPINKQFHKFIIGKDGAKLRKIRAETNTRIDLPAEDSTSNVIIITGHKDNVEKARNQIQEIEREELNLVQLDIIIPNRFHNTIIGRNGILIRSIMQECDNVQIKFPPEGSQSDKVTLRGTKEGVQKAKKQLTELSNDRQLNNYQESFNCRHEFHKYIIGKAGAIVNRIREQTQVRIIFGDGENRETRDTIEFIGKKENVARAIKEIQEIITPLENTVESTVQVPQKYHVNFLTNKGQIIRHIAEDNNNVAINFPPKGETKNSETVTLRGGKEFVESAKARILGYVSQWQNSITHEVEIEQKHHRRVVGSRAGNLIPIEQKYNVQIKFPRKPTGNEDYEQMSEDARRAQNIVLIIGCKESCLKAEAELLDLVPITITFDVSTEYHNGIIGAKGQFLRSLRDQYRVDVDIPPASTQSSLITITGIKREAESAKEAILEKVKSLEEQKLDREARNFTRELVVPHQYHTKLIGKKGAVINEIRKNYDVRINFPSKDSRSDVNEQQDNEDGASAESSDKSQDTITISGYEKNVKNAIKKINKIVSELQSQVTIEISVDPKYHGRFKRANHRNYFIENKVFVRFPADETSDIITIDGPQKNVEACKEYILNKVEEFDDDLTEMYRPPKSFGDVNVRSSRYTAQKDTSSNDSRQQGFFVKDAPWDKPSNGQPDTGNAEEFPSMNLGGSANSGTKVVWGPRSTNN